ncbi:MAG: hypothetical protein HOL01_04695 [Planctomycetaceae bacterium]|nr:hypothetical protein [Planctomycetaceae bacterium]MBT6483371.1 hypothetical protein [Planctomycetaceae bacterium]MBT6493834.1 hypothetical protein [Planctomycetaceae bacterium]
MFSRRPLLFVAGMFALALCTGCGSGEEGGPGSAQQGQAPAIRGEISNPTADKPQSKLWYARNRWWAWLPTVSGSRIWQRSQAGWALDKTLERQLTGFTGRADVWADEETVRAVLVAKDRLLIVSLKWNASENSYRLDGEPTIWPLENGGPLENRSGVETATITRDVLGKWWVAYDRDRSMWVRHSLDDSARQWSEPIAVSEPADTKDFCTIVALPNSVGVFWSDHVADAFLFRRHLNSNASDEWEEIDVVAEGPDIADDHLNAAVADDGTLFVATKLGIDRIGEPQLALHIRRPDGNWESHSYGQRTATVERSRPVVFLSDDSRRLHLCHSVYIDQTDKSRTSHIAWISTDVESLDLQRPEVRLIESTLPVNSPTGAKPPLSNGVVPLVLASDGEGNVYEGRCRATD